MDRRVSVEPFPPGEYIQEFMNDKGWTQDDLARVLGRTRQHINRLLQGKVGITPETAHELAQAFGTSADVWMNLQVSFELALAGEKVRRKNSQIAKRAAAFGKLPVLEVIKRGWLPETDNVDELEAAICRFFQISSIDEEVAIPIAARKSTPYESDTAAQKAWYRRSWQLAEHAPASKYNESQLEDGIRELRKLAAYPEDARLVPRFLQDLGIRFVINQHLTGTKIDGVAFWLDADSPAIAVSLRHGRIDNFWYNIMHEIVHVKHRHASRIDVDMDAPAHDELPDDMEQIANREAGNYLVPRESLESFIKRAGGYFYQTRVVQFAQSIGVHPGIVVGQLHHHPRGLEQRQLRKWLSSIRDFVVGQAITDGWGNMPNLEDPWI
jgi:HTH-type transcriptional regulator/antitoxin HigA